MISAVAPVARQLQTRWKRDPLLRNSAFLMATAVVNGAVGYLYWVVAARVGSTADIGIATSIVAILFFASMATNLGIGPALIQALPRIGHDDRRWSTMVNTAMVAGFVAGVVGSGVTIGFLPTLVPKLGPTLREPLTAMMFVLGAGMFTATLITDCVFVSERRGARMLVRNIVFAVAKLVLVAAPALFGGDVDASWIVASFVLGSAASLVASVVQFHGLGRRFVLTLHGARAAWSELRGSLAAHHLTWFGQNIPQYVLPSIVIARLTAEQNAYFSMAWTVGGVFFMVSPAVAAALFVEGADTEDALASGTRKSALLISGLLGPAMVVFLLGGSFVMSAFGAEYADSTVTLLRLLVLSAIPDGVTNVYTAVLRVRHQLRFAAALNLVIAGCALAGTWVLLPRLGIVGAGWAWIGAQLVGCVIVAGALLAARPRRVQPAVAIASMSSV